MENDSLFPNKLSFKMKFNIIKKFKYIQKKTFFILNTIIFFYFYL